MKREAFGKIGLLPNDFYRMRYSDYVLMQQGYADKVREDRDVLRIAIANLLMPYVEKGKRISKYDIWTLSGDEEEKKEQQEMRSEISKASLHRLSVHKRLEAWKQKEKGQKPKSN